ncbi:hypothetical protein BAE44_0015686 [Dichanthelium oligosanthes]|uniref:SKP1 component dimerisation domain-containing protein n=1 Tax=Dichanthelium oligosanthes TaxID=888268 RepID=A0A1E5VE19_9POAL|nr:hypothetical protein BAE44_0015686 [Dichanthelium oligosanthes]
MPAPTPRAPRPPTPTPRAPRPGARGTPSGKDDDDLASFDKAFIDIDKDTLYDLLLAANYLEVKPLLDLACQKVADMIRGKTPE